MNPSMRNTTHYLCGVDYQHEMDEGFADFFTSIEDLKKAKSCWRQCGIVEIILDSEGNEVSSKWIVEQNLLSQ